MHILLAIACSSSSGSDTGTPTTTDEATTPSPPDDNVAAADLCPPAEFPATDPSLDGYPPVVVCTLPMSGDGAVDPAVTEILVSFSKPMADNAWSWVQIDGNFPETTGDASYDAARRTNTLPVALEPDTAYAVWINDPFGTYSSFQDELGNPAVPYLIAFHTAAE